MDATTEADAARYRVLRAVASQTILREVFEHSGGGGSDSSQLDAECDRVKAALGGAIK